MHRDFLFELGVEELPTALVSVLAKALASYLTTALLKEKINHKKVESFATPRRLAVLIHDMDVLQPDKTISRRGPSVLSSTDQEGKPGPALLGFAKSCGVAVSELSIVKTDKGEWWHYEAVVPGVPTEDLLPNMIDDALKALPIPKLMRWGQGDESFARPIHWALLLFGTEIISADILGVKTGRQSYGHRFHHPQAVNIPTPQSYETALKDAFVIANFTIRRQLIAQQVQQLAKAHQYEVVMPDELLDVVTSIVEWPEALLAQFDKEFLNIPPEVLIASMQSHQKCFALCDRQGQLVPYFITVANIVSKNQQQVINGNERVMRARLSDAAFFYRQDQRQKLSEYLSFTASVVYQEKLGSLQDKVYRMKALMDCFIEPLQLNREHAMRAVMLSKCDLMTGMVGEFPELEGLMGCYYARHDGEDESVALAMDEQYKPRFAEDSLPKTDLGRALSLVDRLDTLVGLFAIGQKPTGDKDPYKLRRHALAVARLLLSIKAPLNLSTLITYALHGYDGRIKPNQMVMAEVKQFILDRLQSFYLNQGLKEEFVLSVRACQEDWLFDLDKRVKALQTFVSMPAAVSLSAACKRVNNILQQVNIDSNDDTVDEALLKESAEKALFSQIKRVEQTVAPLYTAGEYSNILQELSGLREVVDAFFEQVLVMVDDHRQKANRLQLLIRMQHLLKGVADISLL